jgi:hypothetical protein
MPRLRDHDIHPDRRQLSSISSRYMRCLCGCLMGPSPERPCDDVGGVDALLRETLRYPADFLDRPADKAERSLAVVGFVFLGTGLFA